MAGLNVVELGEILSSPQFTDRVVQANTYTTDNHVEAGFAVYHRPDGGVEYSEILHPDDEYLDALADLEELARNRDLSPQDQLDYLLRSLGESEDPSGRRPELDLGRIITTDEVELRTDLAVVAHSHPTTHLGRRGLVRDAGRILRPSATDLLHYADHLAANPGLIEGTTAAHAMLGGAAVFLWRAGDEGNAMQRLSTLEPGQEITEARMHTLGLRTATVTYDRHSGQILKGFGNISNLYQ